jgi:hypothetical protein
MYPLPVAHEPGASALRLISPQQATWKPNQSEDATARRTAHGVCLLLAGPLCVVLMVAVVLFPVRVITAAKPTVRVRCLFPHIEPRRTVRAVEHSIRGFAPQCRAASKKRAAGEKRANNGHEQHKSLQECLEHDSDRCFWYWCRRVW